MPAGEPVAIAILAEACGLAPQPARGAGRPRRLRRHRPAGPDDGPRHRRGPAVLRRARSPRAPPCAARDERRPGEPPGMASRQPPHPPPRSRGTDARFEGLVLDFLSYLELERGLSRNTLNAYRTDLLQYGEFLAAHEPRRARRRGRPTSPTSSPTWRPATAARACSAATIHRKAACLRSFYKHLRRDELIADDPTAALSAPRRAKKLPQVLNYSEVQKLLAAPRGDEPTTLRDRALLEVMYACGLRASETIGLETDRRRPARGLPARPRQGLEGTAGAARPPGDRGDQRLPAQRPAEAGRRAPRGRSCSSTSAAGR